MAASSLGGGIHNGSGFSPGGTSGSFSSGGQGGRVARGDAFLSAPIKSRVARRQAADHDEGLERAAIAPPPNWFLHSGLEAGSLEIFLTGSLQGHGLRNQFISHTDSRTNSFSPGVIQEAFCLTPPRFRKTDHNFSSILSSVCSLLFFFFVFFFFTL